MVIETIKKNWLNATIIIIVFTILDAAGHSYLETNADLYKVPQSYYTNKILFGIPLLLLGIYITDNFIKVRSLLIKSILISSVVILPLQKRYLYLYDAKFNLYIIVLHSLILIPLVWIVMRRKNN